MANIFFRRPIFGWRKGSSAGPLGPALAIGKQLALIQQQIRLGLFTTSRAEGPALIPYQSQRNPLCSARNQSVEQLCSARNLYGQDCPHRDVIRKNSVRASNPGQPFKFSASINHRRQESGRGRATSANDKSRRRQDKTAKAATTVGHDQLSVT